MTKIPAEALAWARSAFGIGASELRRTLERPSQTEALEVDGFKARIYLRRAAVGRGVLAVAAKSPSGWAVSSAYPVPASIPSGLTPLEVLRELCAQFGLPVSIGQRTEKLFLGEFIPDDRVNAPLDLGVNGVPGSGEEVKAEAIVKRDDEAGGVRVALFFCLDPGLLRNAGEGAE